MLPSGRHPVEELICSTVVDNNFPAKVYAIVLERASVVTNSSFGTGSPCRISVSPSPKSVEARLLYDDVRRGKGEFLPYPSPPK
jgi:hypothetical protein